MEQNIMQIIVHSYKGHTKEGATLVKQVHLSQWTCDMRM